MPYVPWQNLHRPSVRCHASPLLAKPMAFVCVCRALLAADVIICTPEKWDGISRSWQNRGYVQRVGLLIIDEIHLLGGDRCVPCPRGKCVPYPSDCCVPWMEGVVHPV